MSVPAGSKRVWYDGKLLLEMVWMLISSIPSLLVALYYITVGTRPKKNVKGEIILITGAGQGLGRAMSLEFSRLGAQLICVDIHSESNQQTVNMIRSAGGEARGYVCDVADRKSIFRLAEEVGRVDILINNAGMYPFKGLQNSTEQELRVIMDVNLFSQFWTAQAFLPGMKQRDHGHLVGIASVAGLSGLAYMEAYSVSKAGVISLMDSLRQETRSEKRENIKLTTICPYFITTRPEIRNHVELRLQALEVDEAIPIIVTGILQELDIFTVPQELFPMLNLVKFLTPTCWTKMYDTFYTQLSEPNEDLLADMLKDKKLGMYTGHLTVQE